MEMAWIPIVAIVGGVAIVALGMFKGLRLRELEYRERIAMIERGLMPPAPGTPLRKHQEYAFREDGARPGSYERAARHRRAGMVLIGIGLSLMILLAFTADANIGIGIGGAFAMLGLTFVGNSLFELRLAERHAAAHSPVNPSTGPSVPPPPAGPVS
jgi:hypothetical protein